MNAYLVAGAAALAALAGPAFAGPDCLAGAGPLMPMWKIAQGFEEANGTIQQMKVSDGCYEIYGRQGERKVEIYYDPRSGAELERDE
jgi:hypothetical protein